MSYHKVLERQIKKALPEKYLEDENIVSFLALVSNAYGTFEKDKKLADHAFSISEKEYQEVNKNLLAQNEIKFQSIQQLKQAIQSLDSSAVTEVNGSGDDLINIIEFLRKQIIKTKELEGELINAKDFAENAARAKTDFLSVMSHEIRTPLNAIIGYIHLLQEEAPLPSQVEFLNILKISADNLMSLINDVLDFGKIEEGKVVFSEKDIDIRQLVNNIKLANRIKAKEKGNTLKILFDDDIPRYLKVDDTRLTQVLNNLISNAVKFTHNGNITIEVHQKRETDTHVELYFAIVDNGKGIPLDKQHIIFDRFTQENSNITREYGGSGLGLAIIRKLLRLQSSDIYVDSEQGKGSKFYFTLQFARSNMVAFEEKQVTVNKQDFEGLNVLLVEDMAFNIMLAQKMLNNRHAKVVTAENGLLAIQEMKAHEFDIVLMDLQMPVMDGFTSSKEIRKFNTITPIIALSASTSSDIQDKAIECGINECISKPLNPTILYDTILKYTNRL